MQASDVLKTAVVRRLRADFNHTRIPGLLEAPNIIQDRPLNSTGEPYVYIQITDVVETDVTKINSSYEYTMLIEVLTRAQQDQDSKRVRDGIVNEICNVLEVQSSGYIDLTNSGFNNYIQTLGNVFPFTFEERGATYFKTNIEVIFTMDFIGLPTDRQPVQNPTYTFTGFEFTPSSGLIELYDTGTVTGAAAYPSANNGWDFVSVAYNPQSPISIGATGDITLAATINYRFSTEPTLTTTLSPPPATFRRIRSVRTGTTSATAFTDNNLATTGLRNFANFNVDYGRTRPVQDGLEISGTAGERIYIIYSAVSPQLNLITNIHQLGGNDLNLFTRTVVGGYQIYLQNRPLSYDSTFTFNIT